MKNLYKNALKLCYWTKKLEMLRKIIPIFSDIFHFPLMK